jgi:hypothetical protein
VTKELARPGSGPTGPAFKLLDSAATAYFILLAFQPSLLPGAQPLPSRSSCSWLTYEKWVRARLKTSLH